MFTPTTFYSCMMAFSLAVQATTPPDTVVTVPLRDGYDLLLAFAAGATLATMMAALLLVTILLLQTWRAARGVQALKARIAADPAVDSLRKAAANVDAISRTVHTEAERLSASVARLTDRLDQASNRIEERIEDLNAFIEVVQSEAEETFVDSAATARGVRAGLGSLARREPPPPAEREALLDEVEDVLDEPM
jgi:hypothetical protein